MSYEFYKIIHLTGIILTFSGLIGLLTMLMSGATVAGRAKSLVFISHGVGLLLALLGGFGLLARLGYMQNMPNWVFAKLAIWLFLGGAIALVKRKAQWGGTLFLVFIAVFILAAYLAIMKPF